MQFVHAREYLNPGQSIQVDCDTEANVILTDDANFQRFRDRQRCTYYGGFFMRYPAVITPPHSGFWNVTIDVAGKAADIRYLIRKVG